MNGATGADGVRAWTVALSRVDLVRAGAEVDLARLIGVVAASGAFREDGHTTVAAWCRASRRWSEAETRVRVRLARLLVLFPGLGSDLVAGRLGVAQANTIARAAANPRCGDRIGDVLATLLEHADQMSHADFQRLVGHWERIADADGAHRDADGAHRQRRAWWGTDDDSGDFTLQLRCGAAQGAQIREVLDVFTSAEFRADWAACVAVHGDQATPDLLRRTDAQRRADAIVAMATAAAATPADAQRPDPLVNIIVDHTTLERFLQHHTATTPTTAYDITEEPGDNDMTDCDNDVDITDGDADNDTDPGNGHQRPVTANDSTGGRTDRRTGRPSRASPPRRRWRGCATIDGHPIPVADAIAAMLTGRIRIVVTDRSGVILHMGRKQRLFTGTLREAVLLAAHECIWNGCNRPTTNCQADHITDWQHTGTTNIDNGAPRCAHHNRFKNHGYEVHRDSSGHWHTYRPDGTEI